MYRNQKGFSLPHVLLILVGVVIIGLAGWRVYDAQKKTDESLRNASNANEVVKQEKKEEPKEDKPYEGWKEYTNSEYGFSFKYPASLKLDEVLGKEPNPNSAIGQISAFNLRFDVNEKYAEASSLEILGKDMATIESWYDKYYAQSPSNSVTKSKITKSGKNGISYKVTNSGVDSLLFLYDMGPRTYTFWTVNESLNAQRSSTYLSDMEKVQNSLTFN